VTVTGHQGPLPFPATSGSECQEFGDFIKEAELIRLGLDTEQLIPRDECPGAEDHEGITFAGQWGLHTGVVPSLDVLVLSIQDAQGRLSFVAAQQFYTTYLEKVQPQTFLQPLFIIQKKKFKNCKILSKVHYPIEN